MMELCPEFRVIPVGIRGYGFWYCFIELWPKSMKIIGYALSILWLCMFGAAGGSVSVFNYVRMINGTVIIAMV